MMNIEEYRKYCISKKGVTESIPFSKLPNILVFKVLGKIFTATDIDTFESFSIKCNPATLDNLRNKYPALKEPSYFNKFHWGKVINDYSIPDELLYQWLDISYNLVVDTLSKKLKTELGK